MIVLSEAVLHEAATTPGARDNVEMTEAATLVGCRIYTIPKDFSQCETAENALWHVPVQEAPTRGVWCGFIPSLERYTAIYDELARKNIWLPNTPDEHAIALDFDLAYERLVGLTPKSVTLTRAEDGQAAEEALGYPVFVRGATRSRKAEGWKACVATNRDELQKLITELFALPYRSRGKVIIRQLAALRHTRVSDEGFPWGGSTVFFSLARPFWRLGTTGTATIPWPHSPPTKNRRCSHLPKRRLVAPGFPL